MISLAQPFCSYCITCDYQFMIYCYFCFVIDSNIIVLKLKICYVLDQWSRSIFSYIDRLRPLWQVYIWKYRPDHIKGMTASLYYIIMYIIYNAYEVYIQLSKEVLLNFRGQLLYCMIYFRIRFFATRHTRRAPFWIFLRMCRMPSHIVTSILVLSKGNG